jgi:hypothetical protein
VTATTLPSSCIHVAAGSDYDIGRLIDSQLAILIDLALAGGADAFDLHLRMIAAADFIFDLECDLEPLPGNPPPF